MAPLGLAALAGLAAGSAALAGAALGYAVRLPPRAVAAVMAAASGLLIAALSIGLMEAALARGGLVTASAGLLAGALAFTLADVRITRRGGAHRKRSGAQQRRVGEGGALAIAAGTVLDNVPEAVVIGASLLPGSGIAAGTVAVIVLSNVAEGLSSAAGMRRAGRGPGYVFALWAGIAMLTAVAAVAGNLLLRGASDATLAVAYGLAAGAILAMVVDTMIPEAFETTHEYAGLVTAAGFILGCAISRAGG